MLQERNERYSQLAEASRRKDGLMKPYDARLMKEHPVSASVNDVRNDDEQCAAAIKIAMEQSQGSLFW
ncbi:MAG: hypothetical protein ACXVZX_11695 [Terriglobales bacterium]